MKFYKDKVKAPVEVLSAIKIKLRVIFALMLRETRTTFGNSSLGYIWALLTPAFGVTILVLLFSFASRQPPFGQSLALFFATGYLTYEYYSKLALSLMTVIDANKALLLYPIVTPTATILARFILISATYFLVMLIFFGALIFLGFAEFPSNPFALMHGFFAISLLGFGIGIFNCSFVVLWDSWRYIFKILTRPLFFISGIFFVPSMLPDNVLIFLKWNPVLHLIEWIRDGYYPNYDSRVLDKTYLFSLIFIFIFLGLLFERKFRNKRN